MQINNDSYCVYIHTFPNGKVYVGITCTAPERRWRADGSGYRKQPVIYHAIKKYGWENVNHEIVASNLTKDEACKFEMLLIDKLKSNQHEFGYNVDNGGQTSGSHSPETLEKMRKSMLGEKNHNYGKEFSKETRERLSLSHKGKKTGADNPAAKSVLCIETGEIFPTTVSAAKAVNVGRGTICSCLLGRSKTAGGYHWKYA